MNILLYRNKILQKKIIQVRKKMRIKQTINRFSIKKIISVNKLYKETFFILVNIQQFTIAVFLMSLQLPAQFIQFRIQLITFQIILLMMGKRQPKNKRQAVFSFRSVGCKPCNFNRLKNTTSFKQISHKAHPTDLHSSKQKKLLSINLKLEMKLNSNGQLKTKSNFKGIIDKWKEKYQKVEQQHYERRKSIGYLPEIKQSISQIKDKKQTRNEGLKEKKVAQSLASQILNELSTTAWNFEEESFKKYSNSEKQLKPYSMRRSISDVQNRFSMALNKHELQTELNNGIRAVQLVSVEQMPARWQTFQEEEVAGLHQQ